LFHVEVEVAGDQVREAVRRGRAGHRVEVDKRAVGCEGLVKLKFGSGDVVEAESDHGLLLSMCTSVDCWG